MVKNEASARSAGGQRGQSLKRVAGVKKETQRITEVPSPGRPGMCSCRSGSSRPSLHEIAQHRGNHEDSALGYASLVLIEFGELFRGARPVMITSNGTPCAKRVVFKIVTRVACRNREPLRDDP